VLQELLEIVGTGEFEDNGNVLLTAAVWRTDSLGLSFRVDHGDNINTSWVVECSGLIEHLITDSNYQVGLNARSSDHPLLDQHTQSRHGLYISVAPSDPDKVVGQLWQAHREAADDWIPFDRFINHELPLRTLLSSGNALISTGPRFLVSAYRAVLENAGCRTSEITAAKPRVSVAQMIHFGESYVIAKDIVATRSAG
jgi:hypothetical protein